MCFYGPLWRAACANQPNDEIEKATNEDQKKKSLEKTQIKNPGDTAPISGRIQHLFIKSKIEC